MFELLDLIEGIKVEDKVYDIWNDLSLNEAKLRAKRDMKVNLINRIQFILDSYDVEVGDKLTKATNKKYLKELLEYIEFDLSQNDNYIVSNNKTFKVYGEYYRQYLNQVVNKVNEYLK